MQKLIMMKNTKVNKTTNANIYKQILLLINGAFMHKLNIIVGEKIFLSDNVDISVLRKNDRSIRLQINAPNKVNIARCEIQDTEDKESTLFQEECH